MPEYRIVTNGSRFRVQRRWRFLWWAWWWTTWNYRAHLPNEFDSLEFAKVRKRELEKQDAIRRTPWQVVSGDNAANPGWGPPHSCSTLVQKPSPPPNVETRDGDPVARSLSKD